VPVANKESGKIVSIYFEMLSLFCDRDDKSYLYICPNQYIIFSYNIQHKPDVSKYYYFITKRGVLLMAHQEGRENNQKQKLLTLFISTTVRVMLFVSITRDGQQEMLMHRICLNIVLQPGHCNSRSSH
jgi:hypothetical protein